MKTLQIDFNKVNGVIKPMNAVNNGPVGGGVRGETPFVKNFRDAKIPFARLHDSAFYEPYGGCWSVDVHRIFRDFNADENDPKNYIFEPTDNYLKNIDESGTKIFYRLGAAIEHYYKFGTIPPKDYLKWAKICEHIILHYTEGWANGFHFDIEYWEIWNEPDCRNADGSNPCWQGTPEQFCEFYDLVSKYLKNKFPHLKIGGPAICTVWQEEFIDLFLRKVKENGSVLDFFSYHCYGHTVENFIETVEQANKFLKKYGLFGVETSLNEWNYNKGWIGEIYKESMQTIINLKGSSFVTGVMCAGQGIDISMLMYYDARPGNWSGLAAESDEPKKTFYAIKAFGELASLENSVETDFASDNIYTAVATNGKEGAILVTYFDDEIKSGSKEIKIEFDNAKFADNVKVEYYLIDDKNDLKIVREEIFTANKFASYLNIELYSTYLIKIKGM